MTQHPKAISDYASQIQGLAQDLTEENLTQIYRLTDEMQSVIHCDYEIRYHLPPVEVPSEEFLLDPGKWVKIGEKRTVRVCRDGGFVLSMGGGSLLGDPMAWCPVCKHSVGQIWR